MIKYFRKSLPSLFHKPSTNEIEVPDDIIPDGDNLQEIDKQLDHLMESINDLQQSSILNQYNLTLMVRSMEDRLNARMDGVKHELSALLDSKLDTMINLPTILEQSTLTDGSFSVMDELVSSEEAEWITSIKNRLQSIRDAVTANSEDTNLIEIYPTPGFMIETNVLHIPFKRYLRRPMKVCIHLYHHPDISLKPRHLDIPDNLDSPISSKKLTNNTDPNIPLLIESGSVKSSTSKYLQKQPPFFLLASDTPYLLSVDDSGTGDDDIVIILGVSSEYFTPSVTYIDYRHAIYHPRQISVLIQKVSAMLGGLALDDHLYSLSRISSFSRIQGFVQSSKRKSIGSGAGVNMHPVMVRVPGPPKQTTTTAAVTVAPDTAPVVAEVSEETLATIAELEFEDSDDDDDDVEGAEIEIDKVAGEVAGKVATEVTEKGKEKAEKEAAETLKVEVDKAEAAEEAVLLSPTASSSSKRSPRSSKQPNKLTQAQSLLQQRQREMIHLQTLAQRYAKQIAMEYPVEEYPVDQAPPGFALYVANLYYDDQQAAQQLAAQQQQAAQQHGKKETAAAGHPAHYVAHQVTQKSTNQIFQPANQQGQLQQQPTSNNRRSPSISVAALLSSSNNHSSNNNGNSNVSPKINGHPILQPSMLVYEKDACISLADSQQIIARSLVTPQVLLGWQILILGQQQQQGDDVASATAATATAGTTGAAGIADAGAVAGGLIYIITDVRKNYRRQIEYQLSSWTEESQWVILQRDPSINNNMETAVISARSGIEFRLLRLVMDYLAVNDIKTPPGPGQKQAFHFYG